MVTTTQIQTAELELLPRLEENAVPESPQEHYTQQLKPADGGRDAWSVLIAGVIFEALFWGFPMCFSVFQAYYEKIPEFTHDKSKIALIGTFAQGLCMIGAPLSALATRRFPAHLRKQILLGWTCAILGLLCASFASSVAGLIVTQGVLYGLGFLTLTYPMISMLSEWWVARNGMAFGLISASSGITGAGLPFVLEALLARYGHRTTLRACAVAMVVLTVPLLPIFRPRLPVSEHSGLARTDWSFVKRPLFWIYAASVLVQGFGFSFPVIFLAAYANVLGLSSLQGALLVAILSIAQVLGQFTFGWLSDHDHLSVSVLASACCLASAAASLVLWGMATSLPWLLAFSVVYGFFAFGFGTMRVAMGRAVSKDHTAVLATFSFFVFLQGVGNVFAGPISAALIDSHRTVHGRYGSGSYETVIFLTGISSISAALVIALWHGYKGVQQKLAMT